VRAAAIVEAAAMDASKKSREEGFAKRLEAFKLKLKRLYVNLCASILLNIVRIGVQRCLLCSSLSKPAGSKIEMNCSLILQGDVACPHCSETNSRADEGATCNAQA
jgi:hypothetical protein